MQIQADDLPRTQIDIVQLNCNMRGDAAKLGKRVVTLRVFQRGTLGELLNPRGHGSGDVDCRNCSLMASAESELLLHASAC